MNYEAHYNTLIERAKNRLLECYTERHHIVPRCMGGGNDAENLVRLTAEEHYVAHQLLVKIHPGNHKLIYALVAMTNLDAWGHRSKNRQYAWTKAKLAEVASKKRKGKTYEEIYNNPNMANEIRKKASERMKGNRNTLGMEPWNKGKPWSEETKQKMATAKCKIIVIQDIRYSSCSEAAEKLGVHRNTITRWLKENKATT